MKAGFNDHVITTRPVNTETGRVAPRGTHGFVIRVLDDPEERYVVELYFPEPPNSDETELTVLRPEDFDVA
jgi:hypothetical protein